MFKDYTSIPVISELENLKFFASTPEQSLYSFDGAVILQNKKVN